MTLSLERTVKAQAMSLGFMKLWNLIHVLSDPNQDKVLMKLFGSLDQESLFNIY